ncbi:MAG: hypothetical protein OHK0028_11250 [Deltaproteobacteria bacterium]
MGLRDSFRKIFSRQDQEDRVSLSRKVQSAPNDPQARQKLGIFLMHQGEVVEGLDQLARSAVLYEKDGFSGKAIAVLRQMLKHDPGNNDFQKWLIRLLAQEGLIADAQVELRKIVSDPARFTTDDQRLDFFRQMVEYLPDNPLPRLYICDVLRGKKKYLEAVNELEKAAPYAVATGMYAEFVERLRSLVSHAGDDVSVIETCGFLWMSIGMPEEGMPILDRVAEHENGGADPERSELVRKVLDAVRGGWNPAAEGAFSFTEAAARLAGPEAAPETAPEAPPAQEPAAPPAGDEPGPAADAGEEEGYEEEESIVRSALGRLQAKVQEEIGDTDLEARYNLGIAYKEMGLLDEAAKEFRMAMRKPELLVGAASLLADTLADRGDTVGAVAAIDEVLDEGTPSSEERRDLRYHKAVLLSGAGRRDDARAIFRELYEESPEYRDVKARLDGTR